ncbi:hypothetical protein [Cohnella massiliensis]|uniref:hypothetical protein n=1 Tax=Cohnella massiliensis TaxID=1816691 RepID=UPI0009BA7B6F|nr:hypothetical protein [Cohnella massiliensis]
MKQELQEKIFTRFPWTRPDESDTKSPYTLFQLECGDGWFQLLWDLFTEIESLYRSRDTEIQLTIGQVKQKFGSLTVYIHDALPEAYEIVNRYQTLSETICESCAIESSIQQRHYYFSTLCDPCYEKRLQARAIPRRIE